MCLDDQAFLKRLEAAVALLLAGDNSEAENLLRKIASPPDSALIKSGRSVSYRTQVEIFTRDGFICRYCGRRTLFPPVLRLISDIFPDLLKYHSHWKISECDIAFWRFTASCDHVVPIARSGSSNPDNLVTACYKCNSIKQNWLLDEMRWNLLPVSKCCWDGLSSLYPKLVSLAGFEKKQYYRRWLLALDNSDK